MDHSQAFRWTRVATVEEMHTFFQFAFRRMQARARDFGYALALHGSMMRDLDVIAVPWTDAASTDINELAFELQKAVIGIGSASYSWEKKPHGRMATSFCICWPEWPNAHHTPGVGHVDLSVIVAKGAKP